MKAGSDCCKLHQNDEEEEVTVIIAAAKEICVFVIFLKSEMGGIFGLKVKRASVTAAVSGKDVFALHLTRFNKSVGKHSIP